MGMELMAPRTDRTTRIPSGVASPVTANHAAKGCVFVNLRNAGNLKIGAKNAQVDIAGLTAAARKEAEGASTNTLF